MYVFFEVFCFVVSGHCVEFVGVCGCWELGVFVGVRFRFVSWEYIEFFCVFELVEGGDKYWCVFFWR